MGNNAKLFFYYLDFSGIIPQFRILNNNRYKSIPSTIISIIIIIFSITFSIYSIIEYMKYDSPSIFYLKKYDNISNKTLLLKDTLFMFKAGLIFIEPIFEFEIDINYEVEYHVKNQRIEHLTIEECKIGKNINIKFKDILEKKPYYIEQYLCISSEHGNLPLSHEPGEEITISITINLVNKEKVNVGIFGIDLITENDLIMHEKKKKSHNYFFISTN